MVNTDGTKNHQVYPDENITWSHISPDGAKIVVTVSFPGIGSNLMIRDLATGHQDNIMPLDSGRYRMRPLWSPSGGSIAYWDGGNAYTGENAKIIHLDGQRRIQDLGPGIAFRWMSDSSIIVARDTTDDGIAIFNVPAVVNIKTGSETKLAGSLNDGIPVLGGMKFIARESGASVLLTREQFFQNPRPKGIKFVENGVWGNSTDNFFYYATAGFRTLERFNLRTLQRTKIVELERGYSYYTWAPDYRDMVITYGRSRLKTNIVRVDNVFEK